MFFNDHNISELLAPFENFEQIFSFLTLYLETKNSFDSSFALNSFKTLFPNSKLSNLNLTSTIFFKRIKEKESDFISSHNKIKDIIRNNNNQFLEPPINRCLSCTVGLTNSFDTKKYVVYNFSGGETKRVFTKKCFFCNSEYSLNFYIQNNLKIYYSSDINVEYIILSNQTIFSKKVIQYLDYQIVRNGVSFDGFEDTYNDLNPEKIKLYRKRLSEQWFNYKICLFEYKFLTINKWTYDETETFIKENFEKWLSSFVKKWSFLHDTNCKQKYCSNTGIYFFLAQRKHLILFFKFKLSSTEISRTEEKDVLLIHHVSFIMKIRKKMTMDAVKYLF